MDEVAYGSTRSGKASLRAVVTNGGFTRFRRAIQMPFNLVLEAQLRRLEKWFLSDGERRRPNCLLDQ